MTPLVNAYRMSDHHPGSSVLTLNGVGHCAMSGGWSECFNKAIRAYLDDGVVPKNGTVCADTTCKPFVKGGECLGPQAMWADGGSFEFARDRPLGIPI